MKTVVVLFITATLLLTLVSCEVNPTPTNDPLTVTAGNDMFATADQTVTLAAVASGGTPPYRFRWSIESVPDDPDDPFDGNIPDFSESTSAEVETLPFDPGSYVYRVRVTDVTGRTSAATITINIGTTPLRVTVPEEGEDDESVQAIAAEPLALTTEINMDGEYTFFWEIVDGAEVILSSIDESTVTVTPVGVGEAMIRVSIRDNDSGDTARQDIVINITQGDSFLVRSEVPDILRTGQSATLIANTTNDDINPDTLSYLWEVTKGPNTRLSATTGRTVSITSDDRTTIGVRVTASGTVNGTMREAFEDLELVVIDSDRPRLVMTTNSQTEGVGGVATLELFADLAPKTVANLLRHVDEGFYQRVLWHRIANSADGTPFVVQCGAFRRGSEALEIINPPRPPVMSEADNDESNLMRTISMALLNNDPDSGTTQFFVNMVDNEFLDDSEFTVFGRVAEGFEVFEAMTEVETETQDVETGGSIRDVPVEDITILIFRRETTSSPDRDDDPKDDEPALGFR